MSTDEKLYKRRIRAWTMYDWANSAFATTILAAVLPIYYSQVAGATLSSPAKATAYWGLGLSFSLLIAALLAPVLGTISDVMRGKKRFLAFFIALGAIGTGLLILVDTGDWLLASMLFIVAKLGFNGANVFYDALLPHVARPEDVDAVSTRGYAMGYLGGGLLLAINVVMINFLPGTWGPRLSFLSVGLWWALFSIPIFRGTNSPTTTTMPPEGVVIVRINNGTFKPALLQISLENQWIVRWVNEDTREYVVAMRDQFESPTLAQGDSFEFNFRDLEPALYRYYTFSGNQRIPGQVDTRPQS